VDEDVNFLRQMAHEFEEGFNRCDVNRIMRFYGDTYVDVNLRHPVQSILVAPCSSAVRDFASRCNRMTFWSGATSRSSGERFC
jgi:hypothetical protein